MSNPQLKKIKTDVVIAGAGPAGMMAALLLAHRGHHVTVLERNGDFDREYRGEVLMPRFIQMMRQIGLWDFLEKTDHLKLQGFDLYLRQQPIASIGVSEISPDAPFILWMPQTVMLEALHRKGAQYANLTVVFNAHVHDLLNEEGAVCGVQAFIEGERVEIRARVTIGADGRQSIVRKKAGFETEYEDHDFDLIWFTIPKPADYLDRVRAFLSERHNYLLLPKYPSHIQCGVLVKVGEYARYRKEGIGSLRAELLCATSVLRPFAEDLKDFAPFTVLAAQADRLKKWARVGVVMIGDAAHTCSPAGAIGVSVAVGTAIVAADVVDQCLSSNDVSEAALSRVQSLREEEVKEIQAIQGRAARIVAPGSFIGKWTAAFFALLIARTGLLRNVQRRLLTASKPLPIRPEFHF